MNWLADWEEDAISPDDDFYDPHHREAQLTGRLYLVVVNQQAIEELLSLWRRYKRDRNVQFPRGQAGWKHLFTQLHDIRRWGPKDRLEETGVIREWNELITNGVDPIRFEAELWCRQTEAEQSLAYRALDRVVREEGGRCIAQSCLPEIAYHAVLVEAPASAIRPVLSQEETRLVRSDQVMYFRPLGQSAHPIPEAREISTIALPNIPLPQGSPVLALLDGIPVENHGLLANRLTVDDPDGWASSYQLNERHHGTSMASLIIHGELDRREEPLHTPLYVRPIMKPDPLSWRRPRQEYIPNDVLQIDLIHRAVLRIISGDGQLPPVAPNVRTINLSIGDPSQPFHRHVSPWARLLDWLAHKYGLLFVVSAGNHSGPVELDVDRSSLARLNPSELQTLFLRAIKSSERHRTLFSPAESINGITVGALHADSSQPMTRIGLDPGVNGNIPAPYTRLGPGFRRSIKPDLLIPGGRQLYRESPLSGNRPATVEAITETARGPGHMTASPGQNPGDISACSYSRGTSNAAALTSRAAAFIHDNLLVLRNEPNGQRLDERYFSVLIKALLVHGARWGSIRPPVETAIRDAFDEASFRRYLARYLGYGVPDFARVIASTDHRATIIGCGALADGTADLFRVPLPPSLSGRRDWRRLVITLAWLSPLSPRNRRYRKAHLWFSPDKEVLGVEDKDGWWQDVQRGTVQHVVMEGESATVFRDGAQLLLRVNCRADAGKLDERVPYGLAVSIEVAEEINIPLYEEIRARLLAPIRITPSA